MDDLALREAATVRVIAENYRRDGYEVSSRSPLDFAPDVSVDLLARKGDEVKVIEVKSRSSLAESSRTSEIAEMVRAKPGWSFELILVGEPEQIESTESQQPLGFAGIRRRLDEATKALADEQAEAAFLLAWSACEATLRVLVADEGAPAIDINAPDRVLDHAVFQGVVSRDEYGSLVEMRRLRSALVHGFEVDGVGESTVNELIELVSQLITERGQPSS
ncbi:MAG: hypothetical protein OXC71_06600 [Chloroflexi bacterium]|nr:hypothetical protein [Chloroflexota bacterium]